MKIATWNVNSLTVRLEHVLEWMESAEPDILALQEIKQTNDMFPADAFKEIGYHAISNGQKTYNGVALISKQKPKNTLTEFSDYDDSQRRILISDIGNEIMNLYTQWPSVESDKYIYKLSWLNALIKHIKVAKKNIIILGDFNIAPEDRDVYDREMGEKFCALPKKGKHYPNDRFRFC